ncbi:hypothetical protein [Thermomonospora cellulosilytica]|uniref:DUF8094 domain-containing protein n=1 Tax=Thermomonospora cellulosilytica TaxID=1411118 RepID=A0A7W3N5E4_9ACTN|nr:hypothetical protein [Thermomonospora cellulosilytica]MBA9007850.1 hypothetical protein [Thermomonospora cellulosilytica]
MKRTSLAVPALALLLGAGAVGCSTEERGASTTPVAAATTPAVPERLTLQVAAREFHRFVNNEDVARASGDERLALQWVSDGQSALTAAEYRHAVFHDEALPRYEYVEPTFYVPKLSEDTYPQWFVVAAERRVRPVAGQEADKEDPRTALMAFIRRSPEARWTLSLVTMLEEKAESPEVELDTEGYATAVLTGETDLLIPPKSVAGIQAAIAEEGPDSVPARLMKPGVGTTAYYHETRRIKKEADKSDLAFDVVFPATLHPVFTLRTTDGGALVLYALSRDTVTLAKDQARRPPIPTEAAHLLDSLILGSELHVSQTLQFAAYDPPKAKPKKPQPKAEVIATGGAVTRAYSPQKVN